MGDFGSSVLLMGSNAPELDRVLILKGLRQLLNL